MADDSAWRGRYNTPMPHDLTIHPDSYCDSVSALAVSFARPSPAVLMLDYVLTGNLEAIRLPPENRIRRGDRLWEQSCFEAFIRAGDGEAYHEFNFTPALEWAAYRFDSYRSGMADLTGLAQPRMESARDHSQYRLSVWLDLAGVPGLLAATFRAGLSAVIEETNGNKSYWALAHPAGKPDFHHPDCFALELGASEQA